MVEDFVVQATEKGQIVIPAALRRKFGIKKGTRLRIVEQGGTIELRPETQEYVRIRLQKMRGRLAGKGVLEALIEDRAWERERDESQYQNRRSTHGHRAR